MATGFAETRTTHTGFTGKTIIGDLEGRFSSDSTIQTDWKGFTDSTFTIPTICTDGLSLNFRSAMSAFPVEYSVSAVSHTAMPSAFKTARIMKKKNSTGG